MKKSDIRDKIKFEALIGLILLIVFVGIGAAMFAGIGTTQTVGQTVSPAPATPSNSTPAVQQTAETVQAGAGSDVSYYAGESSCYDDTTSDNSQTDVTDDNTPTDDDSNSDNAQTDNETSNDDVVDPGDIDNVDDSDISDDEPVPDDLPDGDDLGTLQDVEFLDLVNTETGENFTLDDIANTDLAKVNMDPDGNYTLANYLFDWILAQRESASYFDMENMEVVDPSTEDSSSEVNFGDEDLSFAAGNSSADDNQDNNDNQDDGTNTGSDQNTSDNVEPSDIENPDQNFDNTDEPAPSDALTGDALDDWING